MIILSHPTGNANVRAAVKGINDSTLLSEFHTSVACYPGNLFDILSKVGPLSEIGRRSYDPSLASLTRLSPWKEMGRMLALRLGLKNFVQHEIGCLSVDAVYRSQDIYTAKVLKKDSLKVKGVYSYEDGAFFSFCEAKKHNVLCLYDLPIGYWRAARLLLESEKSRWPEWLPTLTGFNDSDKKLAKKDAELKMADCIFVASSFTANTLKEFPGTLPQIKVIPYGFPDVGPVRDYTFHKEKRKLKLLFVGGLSQRKGIADLFEVVEDLGNDVELTIVGNKSTNECLALDVALSKHVWIPSLPHREVLQLMRNHDVFVFPSLFEGFGLVITEAMSQGTPVITTERTAGPDLINHGENGWIVKAGVHQDLKEVILHIVNNPTEVKRLGDNARETAKLRPWSSYGRELSNSINELLNLRKTR